MKTNHRNKNENKDTKNSPRVIVEKVNKKFGNFATTVECPITQELQECNKNMANDDDNMFFYPKNLTEFFITVSNLKNINTVGIDSVSADVPKVLLPVFTFIFIEFVIPSLSRGWFTKCL